MPVTLNTTTLTNIAPTTATGGGNTVVGTSSINSVGVCWNTTGTPTTSSNKTIDVIIGGAFTSLLTNLVPGVTYYVRAYVVDSGTTYYGSQVTFTTTSVTPTLTTNNPTVTGATTATCGGNVTSNGGSSITQHGVCWSLNPNPTISLPTKTTQGVFTTGSFTSSITGLTAGTTYFIRAYATNANGTSYGDQKTFTTNGGPSVETVYPYSITGNSVVSGCQILSTNGSAITARGVCIGTSENPTINDSVVFTDLYPANGNQYLVRITNLTVDTTYHLRAYAQNGIGISYGEDILFSTAECKTCISNCPEETETTVCPGCEFEIDTVCVVSYYDINCGNSQTVVVKDNNLDSALNNINNQLCTIFTKDFIKNALNNIKNTGYLHDKFCQISCSCDTRECGGT